MINAKYSIILLNLTLGVSFSWYYDCAKAKSPKEASYNTLLLEIKQIYEKSSATYASPRTVEDLYDRGIPVGNNRETIIMREVGIVRLT